MNSMDTRNCKWYKQIKTHTDKRSKHTEGNKKYEFNKNVNRDTDMAIKHRNTNIYGKSNFHNCRLNFMSDTDRRLVSCSSRHLLQSSTNSSLFCDTVYLKSVIAHIYAGPPRTYPHSGSIFTIQYLDCSQHFSLVSHSSGHV